MTEVRLSVVVLSWNTREVLRVCLAALERDGYDAPRELIVVDNASRDGSADMVAAEFPSVRLVRNAENRLFSEGNNQGAQLATGRYLCLMNSDAEVRPGSLRALVEFLEGHPDHGAVVPRLVNPDGSVQRACARFPGLIDPLIESTCVGRFPPGSWVKRYRTMADFDHEHSRDVPQPPAACFVVRREEFLELGGFDPELALFYNDVDLCRRLWRGGRRIRYLAEAEVLHHGGCSTRLAGRWREIQWYRDRTAYYRKHHGPLAARWVLAVGRLWSLEYRLRVSLGSRDARGKRAVLDELADFMRQCEAATGPRQ